MTQAAILRQYQLGNSIIMLPSSDMFTTSLVFCRLTTFLCCLNRPQHQHAIRRLGKNQPNRPTELMLLSLATRSTTCTRFKNFKFKIVDVELNGVSTSTEVDTGASVSIVSEQQFKKLRNQGVTLHPLGAKLCTYTGETINVVGAADVTVKYNGQGTTLPLIITSGTGPSLYLAVTGCLS